MREGETVQLICEVTSNSSNLANYTWYKDGRLLSEAVEKSLMFPQVARKDAGMYFCQVEIQRMSKSSPSLPVSVLCKKNVTFSASTHFGDTSKWQADMVLLFQTPLGPRR